MFRFPSVFFAIVLFVSVLAARGLDRLIVNPAPSAETSQVAALPPPPPAVPESPKLYNFNASQEKLIPIARDGHFYVDAEIDGGRLKRMLIDTGATFVALSYEDAASLGVYPGPGDFKHEIRTANGKAYVALTTLGQVRLGDIVVENVQALVAEPGMLDVSLLGMSFLSRLSRVEASGNELVLRR